MTDTTQPGSTDDPLLGSVLGERYRVLSVLGVGGMGSVYLGEHVALPRRVAIKVLHAELCALPEAVGRFEREARAAVLLDHPNVVSVTDFGSTPDGRFYLAMEHIEGITMRAVLEADGRFEVPRLMKLARQLGAALERAHAIGIVHRDLKPENVMLVRRDGEDELVKVVDFGIAKVTRGDPDDGVKTRAGLVYGTVDYMPPEQALGGEVGPPADIYALGVLLFEALTGRLPFEERDVVAKVSRQLSEPAPEASALRPGELPREVDRVLVRMMAKSPDDRPATVREAVDAFVTALQRPSVAAMPAPARSTPPRAPSPRRWITVGLALTALTFALLFTLSLVRGTQRRALRSAARRVPVATPIAQDAGTPRARHEDVATAVAPLSAGERARRYLALPQTRDGFARAAAGEYLVISRAFARVWRETSDPTVAFAIAVMAAQNRRFDDVVTWTRRALDGDASLARETVGVEAVVRAYTDGAPAPGSRELLVGPMRERAAQVLRAMVLAGTPRSPGDRAAQLLQSALREALDPELDALIRLRVGDDCATRRTALEQLGAIGRAHAVPALGAIPVGPCDPREPRCNACLRSLVEPTRRAMSAR